MTQTIEQREKDLTIKLLETKIEKITGKKVIYENEFHTDETVPENNLDKSHYIKGIIAYFNEDETTKEDICFYVEQLLGGKRIEDVKALHDEVVGTKTLGESKEVITEDISSLIQMASEFFSDPTRIEIAGESLTKGVAAMAVVGGAIGLPLTAAVATAIQSFVQEKGGKEQALKALKQAQPVSKTPRR